MSEYTDEYLDDQSENVKRSPAVEYGYDKKESPYAGCMDCFQVSERMLCACHGKHFLDIRFFNIVP